MKQWETQFEETIKQLASLASDPIEDDFYRDSLKYLQRMPNEARELRYAAMDNLYTFARLVHPEYQYGDIHKEAYDWIQNYNLYHEDSEGNNKLLMFPRAHLKSHIVATAAAWLIVRHPEVSIIYLSATSELAEMQLYAIKIIFESPIFKRYWPEYVHPLEGKRKKWTERKIIIDHPRRRLLGRDATVTTAGLTTNTTGWHADIIIPDDLVVPENAYTEDGREKVRKKASQFTSIRNAGGFTLACGTRYHPTDIYASWKDQETEIYDDDGNFVRKEKIWQIMERVVEINDVFLWPRVIAPDGKAYGFNKNVLARIKGEYEDITQFFAQYYNDPNSVGSERITRDCFQYYDPKYLKYENSTWWFKDQKLNIYAAIDFAYSLNKRADYTAIVVIGIAPQGDVYILDIERFRTDKITEYFRRIVQLHSKWWFRQLRAEVTAAQQIIVNDIKDYVRKEGLTIKVLEHRPTRHEGTKEERIAAALESRYENLMMWHYKGGFIPVLEEELVLSRPPHDDVKDALASAVEIAVKPKNPRSAKTLGLHEMLNNQRNRFGGVPYR